MKKESKSQRFFYLSLCLKDNINIIYYNSLGVLSDYKNKWKIVLILGLLAIRIVNLGFNIFDLIFLKPSSPFVPDFLYEELAKPYVVLLAIYLFFLSLLSSQSSRSFRNKFRNISRCRYKSCLVMATEYSTS